MKKFLSVMFALILSVCVFGVCGSFGFNKAYAQTSTDQGFLLSEIETELKNFVEHDSVEKHRLDRTAGSEGERLSAEYIAQELSGVQNLKALENAYFKNGIQTFNFVSTSGEALVSQNVGFVYSSNAQNAKTVVLATHYDNEAIYRQRINDLGEIEYYKIVSEGINSSAGAVAMLMSLAKYIAEQNLVFDFNIEFLFFGASSNDYMGAQYYLKSITQNKDNYALVVNFSNIAIGDYNYVYCQEFNCQYKTFVENKLIGSNNFERYSKISSLENTGSGYTHAGLMADSFVFFEDGMNVANIFSGSHQGFSSLGAAECEGYTQITNTEKDTIIGIEQTLNVNVAANLSRVASAVISLISDDGFIGAVSENNNLSGVYDFIANEKLQIFIFAVLVVVLFVVYYAIYDSFLKKSRNKMKDENLAAVVVKIQGEMGDISSEMKNEIKEKIDKDVDDIKKS